MNILSVELLILALGANPFSDWRWTRVIAVFNKLFESAKL